MNSFLSYIVIISIVALLLESVQMNLFLGMTLLTGIVEKELMFFIKYKEFYKILKSL
jgi:hypothetical protein